MAAAFLNKSLTIIVLVNMSWQCQCNYALVSAQSLAVVVAELVGGTESENDEIRWLIFLSMIHK